MNKPFYVSLKPFLDHTCFARPYDWEKIFGNQHPLYVEIGFGNGEYLASVCAKQSEFNYVGFEQYCARIHKTLRKLSRVKSDNVRVMRLDAKVGIEQYFGARTIDKIVCLYPPPWPKKSDAKHRLFTTAFLQTVNNRLVDQGQMLLVTDYKPYMDWLKEQVTGSGFDTDMKVIKPVYGTKFENKWVEGGQQEFYEIVLTKREHQDVKVREDESVQTYVIPAFNPDNFVLGQTSEDNVAVALKDFLFDAKRQIGMVYGIITDEGFTQHVRFEITHVAQGWRIGLAQGALYLPTQGVSKALSFIHDLAQQSIRS